MTYLLRQETMSRLPRIYLDNAATTWPKPESVYAAVDKYQRELGTSPARGVYAEAIEADRIVDGARRAVAELIGAEGREQVAFAFNGTDALNMAIHGILRPGDHVVTTVVDHNSVLRPLHWLEERGLIQVTRVECNAAGVVDAARVRAALRSETRLVAVVHASNVTGAIQPVADIGRLVRPSGALLLVDAAQSLGHVPIDVRAMGVDLLAAPGHKGLLGPLGTGILYFRPGLEDRLESFRQGGTGTHSDEDRQPQSLPDKYEPGNHNAAGLSGLRAGVAYLQDRGLDALRAEEIELTGRLMDGLAAIPGATLYGPCDPAARVGVVSVTLQGYSPQECAAALDSHFRVQVRAGIHCAPLMHRALGTLAGGGTVRFSLGPFNTCGDVDAGVAAVGELAGASCRVHS
jgi:cysteine desulfurase family protein